MGGCLQGILKEWKLSLWFYAICGGLYFLFISKMLVYEFAIHATRLTIHEADVRNPGDISDKLVEDWR